MHPSDSELQGLADGELAPGDGLRLRLHLEACDACARRLRSVELADRRIAEWLTSLDHPVPGVDPTMLMAPARPPATRGLLLAASLAALLAAGAAAAVIPGSPLRHLAERAIAAWRGDEPPRVQLPDTTNPPPPQSGVAFVPGPELEIAFRRSQAEGTIRISLTDGPEVRVRQLGGTAAYAVDSAELTVDNADAVRSYEILLPRRLHRARVRVGDRVVFEKEGSAISCRGFVDGQGVHVVPFAVDPESRP